MTNPNFNTTFLKFQIHRSWVEIQLSIVKKYFEENEDDGTTKDGNYGSEIDTLRDAFDVDHEPHAER